MEERATEICISTDLVFSISQPVIYAARGNPTIKPADAPASKPIPPLPPANNGKPTNVKRINNNVTVKSVNSESDIKELNNLYV